VQFAILPGSLLTRGSDRGVDTARAPPIFPLVPQTETQKDGHSLASGGPVSFSKRHYRLVSPPADTPEAIVARLARRAAWKRAEAEVKAAYPVLTDENVDAALKLLGDLQTRYEREAL
jgi:hypothetical protein